MEYGDSAGAFVGWKQDGGQQLSGSGARAGQAQPSEAVARSHQDRGRAAKPPSEQTCLPPKKWQLICLSPLPDPWLTSTALRVQCLHAALPPPCGDSKPGICASCPWASALLASSYGLTLITCPGFSALLQSTGVSDGISGCLFPQLLRPHSAPVPSATHPHSPAQWTGRAEAGPRW